MARGGHVDVCVTGALEVDERGNLASWTVPGEFVRGPGAAMDLAVGAERVIAAMNHVGPSGELAAEPVQPSAHRGRVCRHRGYRSWRI